MRQGKTAMTVLLLIAAFVFSTILAWSGCRQTVLTPSELRLSNRGDFAQIRQQREEVRPSGTIYGTATTQDGKPADRVVLTAAPLGVVLATVLPQTMTSNRGEYQFKDLPWWGRYTVYADDEKAGFSPFSTGTVGQTQPSEVEISPQRREAKLKVVLPPKAAFLRIKLTNRRTGSAISSMRVAVMPRSDPHSLLFMTDCYSTKVVLIPPNKDLLLHVTSDGFGEWRESVGKGKPVHLDSGTRLTLNVQLEPTK